VLRDNLERVRERVRRACERCGRPPASVTLIGVTKTVPPELIAQAVALGLTELGENRVQEAREKQRALDASGVRWHLIGHLQSNKAKLAAELFNVVQSLDSLPLAQELERRASALDVFVQVNVAGEQTKFGCRPEDAEALARAVRASSHLRLAGLMTIPPLTDDAEGARPYFRRLRELREQVATACGIEAEALKLSMGMSHDFEVAIEEGADLIRLGTAIFGARTT
jgi:hypothetical protein